MRRAEQIITGSRTEILASNGKRCAKSRIYSISKGRDIGPVSLLQPKITSGFQETEGGATDRGRKEGEERRRGFEKPDRVRRLRRDADMV